MRQNFNVPLTWYAANAGEMMPVAALNNSLTCDVVVVGGGLAGLTTTLELARAGKSVTLLEANQIAFGASGRNGGFVSSGFALGFDEIAARVGEEAAQQLHQLSQAGTEYVRREIATADTSIKMGDGWMVMVRHPDRGGLERHGERMARVAGEDYRYLGTADLRARVNSERYFAGLLSSTSFHIQSLRYARMLAKKATELGVQIFEGSKVVSVLRKGSGWVVKTGAGAVTARHVVYCVSALDRTLHKASGRSILPVATYVAVTEPLAQTDIKTSAALSDTRRAGDYYRLIDESRLLWGGRITTRVSSPRNLANLMQGDIGRVYPRIGLPRIDFVWPGLMGYAIHKMPVIGHDGQGQWFATGFGGHGLNTTAMAGQLVAQAIAGQDDSFRRFAAFGPDWAYGPVGRVGVQGSYWLMQIKDRLDERGR
jgi:glycine/D-amino acid oxidase-like deaminating enzyme